MPKNRRRARQLRRLDNLDKISKLPDDVLSCILSRLPIKDAVATSVLSKRWEDVWTNIPTLEFSDQFQRTTTNEFQDKITKFKDIVDTVLYRHAGSKIENCRISFHSDYASASFYSWIWAVVCCSVQELTLQRPSLYNAIGDRDLPKLKHLSRLELGVNEIYNEWRLLPKLLESAPNLEVLVFPKGLVARKNNREFGRFYWRPLEHVPECLLFRLKTIEIRKFVGVPGEKHLVKFLLESSKVLEKMMVHCRNFLENKQWKSNRTLGDALNQIENMAKGSEACEVEFFYEQVHK